MKIAGFYHEKGLVPAWNLAKSFAQKEGRIATLPDIIEMRLNSKPTDFPWTHYFTTNTAEYVGIGKDGSKKIIVAHGVGPMSTLSGALKAYSYEYKNKKRNHRGGRITQKEFLDLEAGKYGPVKIIDFCSYASSSLLQKDCLSSNDCMFNGLLHARIGDKAYEYIKLHSKYASEWYFEEFKKNNKNPGIIELEDASNCSYLYRNIENGLAFAHLISIGSLIILNHQYFSSDISCHEWWNGTRFVGIKKDADLSHGIDACLDPDTILKKNWKKLMIPVLNQIISTDLRISFNFAGQKFASYPKIGSGLDSYQPEYLILSQKPVGKPIEFKTEIMGYEGLFKYYLNEIQAIAPKESNVYSFVTNPIIIKENNISYHSTKVQFYQAEIDYSQRLIHSEEISKNYNQLIGLLEN